jgi:hypothetical protein
LSSRIATAAALLATLTAQAPAAEAAARVYDVRYTVRIVPERKGAEVTLELEQRRHYARELAFSIDPERQRDFAGDGDVERDDDRVVWTPPERGGRLTWFASLESTRSSGAYDGMVTEDWAVFRGDDLVPPATVTSLRDAESRARLAFRLPKGWSSVTAYPRGADGVYDVAHDDRSFDRPTGWMALGRLGVKWTKTGPTRIAVAGPVGAGLRHNDVLAFLRWTVPTLRAVFPGFTERLLVVSAGDPFWRGGLSGPSSLFMHADRPLISQNGTSTLVHELVHVAMRLRAEREADWIVEGFAEYYSLEVLRRSGTVSVRDWKDSIAELEAWGKGVDDLFTRRSSGAKTARAVLVLKALDEEIVERTGAKRNLDDVVRELAGRGAVSFADLRRAAADVVDDDRPLRALAAKNVPGAPD